MSGLSARAAQLSSPVRAHARGYSRARTVQALADGAPGRMEISKDDPTAFSLGILGDLHMDPRDLDHSFEGREHMKAVLQVRLRTCPLPPLARVSAGTSRQGVRATFRSGGPERSLQRVRSYQCRCGAVFQVSQTEANHNTLR